MRRTEVLQGVWTPKFRGVLDRWENGEPSRLGAEMPGVWERTFRRWCGRYREEGEAGLQDRRSGREAPNRAPDAEAARVEAPYRERFQGFTSKHFHELLVRDRGSRWGYTWIEAFLQRQGRGPQRAAPRRGAHHREVPGPRQGVAFAVGAHVPRPGASGSTASAARRPAADAAAAWGIVPGAAAPGRL